MEKGKLKNGMEIRVRMDYDGEIKMIADVIVDVNQAHGVWTERCHLVGEDQIYPATPESADEIKKYMRGGEEMLTAGDRLMAALIEPEFI